MDDLLAARLQMAFTLGSHIILACFGVGLPVLMLAAEWKYLRTQDPLWKTLAMRWSKAFAVLFAVGAVSGTVLSFELGLLWPDDEIPPVPIVHFAFQLMVAAGMAILLFSIVSLWRVVRNRRGFYDAHWFLWLAILMGPLAVIALETGWTVTEVGRQPWIVYGVMRTRDAVTGAAGVNNIFVVTILIYLLLTIGSLSVLRHLAGKPIDAAQQEDAGNDEAIMKPEHEAR